MDAVTMKVLSVEDARGMGLPWVLDTLDHRFERVWFGTYADSIARCFEVGDERGLRLLAELKDVSWRLFKHAARRNKQAGPGQSPGRAGEAAGATPPAGQVVSIRGR